jgi:hypothetical protein
MHTTWIRLNLFSVFLFVSRFFFFSEPADKDFDDAHYMDYGSTRVILEFFF